MTLDKLPNLFVVLFPQNGQPNNSFAYLPWGINIACKELSISAWHRVVLGKYICTLRLSDGSYMCAIPYELRMEFLYLLVISAFTCTNHKWRQKRPLQQPGQERVGRQWSWSLPRGSFGSIVAGVSLGLWFIKVRKTLLFPLHLPTPIINTDNTWGYRGGQPLY